MVLRAAVGWQQPAPDLVEGIRATPAGAPKISPKATNIGKNGCACSRATSTPTCCSGGRARCVACMRGTQITKRLPRRLERTIITYNLALKIHKSLKT